MAAALAIIYTGGCKRLKGEKKKIQARGDPVL